MHNILHHFPTNYAQKLKMHSRQRDNFFVMQLRNTVMLDGLYYDPLHGHCLRRIQRVSANEYDIIGVYGDDEQPDTWKTWYARIRASPEDDTYVLSVDFAGKPRKQNRFMTARWSQRQIHWEDGNVWKQLYVSSEQIMPRRGRVNSIS